RARLEWSAWLKHGNLRAGAADIEPRFLVASKLVSAEIAGAIYARQDNSAPAALLPRAGLLAGRTRFAYSPDDTGYPNCLCQRNWFFIRTGCSRPIRQSGRSPAACTAACRTC